MGELSTWPSKALSEIGELIRGRRFTKNDYVESGLGCIHYAQIYTGFGTIATKSFTFLTEDSRTRMRLAYPGDLVIAATSENVDDVGKAVAWLGEDDVAVHDDCYIFRHGLDPVYVSYFFASSLFHMQKIKYVSETKVVRISGANLSRIKIPVPPRQVQERIVNIIGAMDDQIVALDAESKALETILDSLRSDLPQTDHQPIGDVLLGVDSGKSVQAGGEASAEDEYRILRLSAVQRGWFKPSEAKKLAEDTAFSLSHVVKNGDLLITRANTPERVGFVAVAKNVPEGTFMPDLIWRLRVDESRVSTDYLEHVLSSHELRTRISGASGGTSKSMVKINKRSFGAVRVPIPPLPEQGEYVQRCFAVVEQIAATRAEEARLRKLRAGLLSGLLDRTIDIESADLED